MTATINVLNSIAMHQLDHITLMFSATIMMPVQLKNASVNLDVNMRRLTAMIITNVPMITVILI
jgi:hypothetical protein